MTLKQEELLVRLMEECAELQHACAKVLRWGWDSCNPDNIMSVSNEETLFRESDDVKDIFHRLRHARESISNHGRA